MPPSPLAHGCAGGTGSLVPCGAEPCLCHPASPGDRDAGAQGARGVRWGWKPEPPARAGWAWQQPALPRRVGFGGQPREMTW